MCCATVALVMALLGGCRSASGPLAGSVGWLRRITIVVIAIGAAGGSATAADQFATAGGAQQTSIAQSGSTPICSHLLR